MIRRLLNLFGFLSLLLSAAAFITICVSPSGITWVVYHGSFGWGHGQGWAIAGVDLYEVHVQSPVVVLWVRPRVLYFLVFAGQAVPVVIWMGRRFIAQPATGLCPSCGYDLRATPDRCPECGTAATTPA